jgi:hypothetical protein
MTDKKEFYFKSLAHEKEGMISGKNDFIMLITPEVIFEKANFEIYKALPLFEKPVQLSAHRYKLTSMAHLEYIGKLDDVNVIDYFLHHGAKADDALNYGFVENMLFKGKFDVVEWLFQHGADIHSHNERLLRVAIAFTNYPMIKFLIEHGADMHVSDNYVLSIAILKNDIKTVEFLIKNGMDVNTGNHEPLRRALEFGNRELADLLIKNGAKPYEGEDASWDDKYAQQYYNEKIKKN